MRNLLLFLPLLIFLPLHPARDASLTMIGSFECVPTDGSAVGGSVYILDARSLSLDATCPIAGQFGTAGIFGWGNSAVGDLTVLANYCCDDGYSWVGATFELSGEYVAIGGHGPVALRIMWDLNSPAVSAATSGALDVDEGYEATDPIDHRSGPAR